MEISASGSATAFMEAGFIVIPIRKGVRHPDYQSWSSAANTQQAMQAFLERHGRPWHEEKDAIFAVRMPRKWICIDIDTRADAEEVDDYMRIRHPDDWFDKSIHVHTPSGGKHVYVQIPDSRGRWLSGNGPNLVKRVFNLGKGNAQVEVEVACSPSSKHGYGGCVMGLGSRVIASEKDIDKQRRRGIPKAERAQVGDELFYEPGNVGSAKELKGALTQSVSAEFAEFLKGALVDEDDTSLQEYDPNDPMTMTAGDHDRNDPADRQADSP